MLPVKWWGPVARNREISSNPENCKTKYELCIDEPPRANFGRCDPFRLSLESTVHGIQSLVFSNRATSGYTVRQVKFQQTYEGLGFLEQENLVELTDSLTKNSGACGV